MEQLLVFTCQPPWNEKIRLTLEVPAASVTLIDEDNIVRGNTRTAMYKLTYFYEVQKTYSNARHS